ncbi:MAG: hypothetical protein WC783_00985 [Candidatus Paceibacterota bacterium]|jgi:hypothetical protein
MDKRAYYRAVIAKMILAEHKKVAQPPEGGSSTPEIDKALEGMDTGDPEISEGEEGAAGGEEGAPPEEGDEMTGDFSDIVDDMPGDFGGGGGGAAPSHVTKAPSGGGGGGGGATGGDPALQNEIEGLSDKIDKVIETTKELEMKQYKDDKYTLEQTPKPEYMVDKNDNLSNGGTF